PRHPHVPTEDVGGHAEPGHVAEVARAVGVRPGDCGEDLAHGPILVTTPGGPVRGAARFGSMETLIAEDLLLLLLDDDKGTMAASSYERPLFGGAVLVELALAGLVRVEEKRRWWGS